MDWFFLPILRQGKGFKGVGSHPLKTVLGIQLHTAASTIYTSLYPPSTERERAGLD